MKILLGSDKSGFALKEAIRAWLEAENIEYVDVGTQSVEAPMPFYTVAPPVAEAIAQGTADRAILLCGTGMGMAQVATKYAGVLAACCESVYAAKMARAINDANILCMGGWIVGPEMGIEMAKVFLNTGHTEGLEPWRQDFLKEAAQQVRQIDGAQRRQAE